MSVPIVMPVAVELVDEFGRLDGEVKRFAAKAKRHAELAKLIRSAHSTLPPEKTATLEGKSYSIMIGECGEERALSLPTKLKAFAILKKKRFVELVSITLTAIEKAPELGEEWLEKWAVKERTGSRKLVAVAKIPLEGVAKAA